MRLNVLLNGAHSWDYPPPSSAKSGALGLWGVSQPLPRGATRRCYFIRAGEQVCPSGQRNQEGPGTQHPEGSSPGH